MSRKTRFLAVFSSFFVFAMIFAEPVMAETLKTVIDNVIISFNTVPGLLAGLCYLMGLILGCSAIFKLIEHVNSPQQVQLWDPLKRFLAGGMCFALPTVLYATENTVAWGLMYASATGGVQGAGGTGLDAMMVALISDIYEPMYSLIGAFGYLAGIILVIVAISRLLKTEQDGPRGPTGIGTLMTILVAGAMLSLDRMFGAISSSLFRSTSVKTIPELVYKDGLGGTEAHIEAVISAVVAFVIIIGWISVVRGFFIIRGVAEGNSQASIMAGMTHLLGGGLAINLGPVINAVQATLGIDTGSMGIVFS